MRSKDLAHIPHPAETEPLLLAATGNATLQTPDAFLAINPRRDAAVERIDTFF